MNVLFLHRNFPAQFRHVAGALAAEPDNRVVFGTARRDTSYQIPGVTRAIFEPSREPNPGTHPYLRSTEEAVLTGQAVARMCHQLARRGFRPDVVVAHSGWGPALYVKETAPDARLLTHVEWYYRPGEANLGWLPPDVEPWNDDLALSARTKNVSFLYDLVETDWSWVPTAFQQRQLPDVLQRRTTVLHEGIDTEYFAPPATDAGLDIPGLHLPPGTEILSYATRGMEPYRGFPQFMRAAAMLCEARPDLHVVIAGEDRVVYGAPRAEGDSWRARLGAELGGRLDPERVHFVGGLPYKHYKAVLAASSVHVYLTIPFVLSWGMLEAMAMGVRLVASDTEPVREVVSHGENGVLVDFADHEGLAARVHHMLEHPDQYDHLCAAARATIVDRYALASLLPQQCRLIGDVAAGRTPP